jgi:hypothetical protein
MAYDESKDVLIAELGEVGDTGMVGELRQYNNGPKKVVIHKVINAKGTRRQVFRMPLAHAVELGEFLDGVAAQHGVTG